MLVRIPVSGRFLYRLLDFLPGLKAPPFEGQRLERLPPGLDQVQVRRIRRLENKLPARVGQIEEQDIDSPMHRQVVQHSVDPLYLFGDPLFHVLKKVDPID